jgi:hypothetical protein
MWSLECYIQDADLSTRKQNKGEVIVQCSYLSFMVETCAWKDAISTERNADLCI